MMNRLDRCARCGSPGPGLCMVQLPVSDADRDGRIALCAECDDKAREEACRSNESSRPAPPSGPPGTA
jgi:hypothetical protein